jgi:hypothetical protein
VNKMTYKNKKEDAEKALEETRIKERSRCYDLEKFLEVRTNSPTR